MPKFLFKLVTKKKRKKREELKMKKVYKNKNSKTLVLETTIDKLYKMVIKQKRVEISDAAKMFGVKEELIIEWGKILEEHDLVELHYPAFGKPFLIPKEMEK